MTIESTKAGFDEKRQQQKSKNGGRVRSSMMILVLSRYRPRGIFAILLALTANIGPGARAQSEQELYLQGEDNLNSKFVEVLSHTPATMLDLGILRLEGRLSRGLDDRKWQNLKITRASVSVDEQKLVINVFGVTNSPDPATCQEIWTAVKSVAAGMSERLLSKSAGRDVCSAVAGDFAPIGNSELEASRIVLDPAIDPCAAMSIAVRITNDVGDNGFRCIGNFYDREVFVQQR